MLLADLGAAVGEACSMSIVLRRAGRRMGDSWPLAFELVEAAHPPPARPEGDSWPTVFEFAAPALPPPARPAGTGGHAAQSGGRTDCGCFASGRSTATGPATAGRRGSIVQEAQ
eukprot:362547-Chlamydomonas_euryale.AAC.6